MALLSRVLNHNSEKARIKNGLTVSKSNVATPTPVSRGSLTPVRSTPITSTTSSSSSLTSLKTKALTFALVISLESPPIMLYGQPHESSGSIISGNLSLDIYPPKSRNLDSGDLLKSAKSMDSKLTLESVTLSLIQTMKYSRPFVISSNTVANCRDCQTKTTVLARWDVLTSPTSFPTGSHAYPFSHFLPGSLPPTSKLGSINSNAHILYKLVATGTLPNSTKETSTTLPLFVSRLVLRGPDKNSLRVFPPTDVSASAVLPNVFYPKSTFPLELKLDNVVSLSGERRWRMRKLSWKIDEFVKVRAHCCDNHTDKLTDMETIERKNKNIPSPAKQAKNSHQHHSTIVTNTHLTRNPSQQASNPTVNDPNEIELPTEEEEPTNNLAAPDTYVEDFVNPQRPAETQRDNQETVTPAEPTLPVAVEDEEHLYFEEIRTVAHGEIKSGWKSDFSGSGSILLVADIKAFDFSTGFHSQTQKSSSDFDDKSESIIQALRNNANVCCDVDDPVLGVFVSHTLIVSVVVAEELVHSVDSKKSAKEEELRPVSSSTSETTASRPKSLQSNTSLTGVPTGAARVLRMQFKVILTERSGLGIAWDDEVPPTYNDVKTLSPPTYNQSSNAGTPVLGSNVIYGVGNTPLIGTSQDTPNIDSMMISEDRIQEFTL